MFTSQESRKFRPNQSMGCRPGIRSRTACSRAGMTLPEVLVASAIGSIALAALASVAMYSARNFATVFNYVDMDSAMQTFVSQNGTRNYVY